jgi:SAM-dependent methyltransferase
VSLDQFCRYEGIRIEHADIERDPLPLDNESVDAVLLTEVIEHLWHDPLFALTEINRVLKCESGILIVSTPNLTSLRNRLNFLCGKIQKVIEHPFVSFLKARRVGHLGHCRLYAPGELATMLQLFGFEPSLWFTRYDHWDQESSPNGRSESKCQESKPHVNSRSGRRGLMRRLLKSPRKYWAAMCATSLELMERWIPHFRPQVFVVARKKTDADYDKNFPSQLKQLVHSNVCE